MEPIDKYLQRFPEEAAYLSIDEAWELLSPDFFYAFQFMFGDEAATRGDAWDNLPIYGTHTILDILGTPFPELRSFERWFMRTLDDYRHAFFHSRPILKCHKEMKERAALHDLVVMFKSYETMRT